MQLRMFQVDAFATKLFSGNPAAVVILESDIDENLMQSIAAENNLSETAFVNIIRNPIGIRWFTPTTEVELCGHATLATAKILFGNYPHVVGDEIVFQSKRGALKVFQSEDLTVLDFPANKPKVLKIDLAFEKALGDEPVSLLRGRDDYLVVFDNQSQIEEIKPNFQDLAKLNARGVVISAPGHKVDFVSRCFYPQTGINEDPVTGSAHTMLIPYWAEEMNKNKFVAHQLSSRGGELQCSLNGDRVLIAGHSVVFLEGTISITSTS